MQTNILLEKLITQTRQNLSYAQNLQILSIATLSWRKDNTSWNILECLEHLNLYGDFYLPAIKQQISMARPSFEPKFKSGLLGNYFAKSMLPKATLNKMNTFNSKNPLKQPLNLTTIERFIEQQQTLILLLQQSNTVNWNKVKIPTSISRLLKLNLGDTFQFIINHNIRHLQQIENLKRAQGIVN